MKEITASTELKKLKNVVNKTLFYLTTIFDDSSILILVVFLFEFMR